MRVLLSIAALIGLSALDLQDVAGAHGGTYRGPSDSGGSGDTAPPAGGSGSGGSGTTSGGSGSTPGTSPGNSGGSSSSGSTRPRGPSIPRGSAGAPWEPWWAFNRDPFLNLKAVLHEGSLVLGSDDYFLGHGSEGRVRDQLRPSEEVIREQVVPALLRVLEEENDNDLVTGAIIALAKIGDPEPGPAPATPLAETFRPFLASGNQEIAETAAVALGILANDTSALLLGDLLRDRASARKLVGREVDVPWRTRAFAAYGLGLIGHRTADPDVRRLVLELLRETFEGDALTMATPDVGVACLNAMGIVPLPIDEMCTIGAGGRRASPSCCRRGQIEWLRQMVKRPQLNYVLRSHVPTALARLSRNVPQDPQLRVIVASDLIQLATGSSKVQRDLRASAVLGLGMIGTAGAGAVDEKIAKALMKVVSESRQPEVRTLALIALGQTGGRRNAQLAVDPKRVSDVRKFLLGQFANGRSTDRPWAALAVGLQERAAVASGLPPSMSARSPLRAALVSAKSPTEVGAYAIACGVMCDEEAAKLMIRKLGELSEDRSRGYLCIGLGLMNAREGIEPMRALLAKSRYRPLLLREAAISLGLIGDKNVVDDLVEELHRATSLTTQSSIAAALGHIGDGRSIPPLLAMLEDEEINVRARAFSAVALGIVADKEPLPWNAKIAVGANYLAGTPTLTDGVGKGILDIL
jgi:HEAT repeat protein